MIYRSCRNGEKLLNIDDVDLFTRSPSRKLHLEAGQISQHLVWTLQGGTQSVAIIGTVKQPTGQFLVRLLMNGNLAVIEVGQPKPDGKIESPASGPARTTSPGAPTTSASLRLHPRRRRPAAGDCLGLGDDAEMLSTECCIIDRSGAHSCLVAFSAKNAIHCLQLGRRLIGLRSWRSI
jgi:hypothetical protein